MKKIFCDYCERTEIQDHNRAPSNVFINESGVKGAMTIQLPANYPDMCIDCFLDAITVYAMKHKQALQDELTEIYGKPIQNDEREWIDVKHLPPPKDTILLVRGMSSLDTYHCSKATYNPSVDAFYDIGTGYQVKFLVSEYVIAEVLST